MSPQSGLSSIGAQYLGFLEDARQQPQSEGRGHHAQQALHPDVVHIPVSVRPHVVESHTTQCRYPTCRSAVFLDDDATPVKRRTREGTPKLAPISERQGQPARNLAAIILVGGTELAAQVVL